jgi:DNA topoisomerase-3
MIAIIAEKPSVAREIAAIVGATEKKDGYLSGNNYWVTWALGHLIQLAMPEDYGLESFVREQLPILPETFKLIPRQLKDGKEYKADPGALRQLRAIGTVFDRCDSIIAATDAGREGELIFRYIYTYLECNKPFTRLWISSLTEKAIREGLAGLKPGTAYDKLYDAARARSQADWLVGINASRALSIAAGGAGACSLGRVQTPTLAMICSRYLENNHFAPTPYWQLRIRTEKNRLTVSALSEEKYPDKQAATTLFEKLRQEKYLRIVSTVCTETVHEPPLLYDLTALQKEANTRLGFSADKTLQIAQKLYENKLITYPRTGSRHIPEDVFDAVPSLLNNLRNHSRFGKQAGIPATLNRRSVDDKKITDHHAILITENIPSGLLSDEQAVYDLIAGRMLEAFSPKSVVDVTTVKMACAGILFQTKGTVMKQAGWRAVFDREEDREEAATLPPLEQEEQIPLAASELLEKQTKPKPLFTESSLLTAMEQAGKELEDETQRKAMTGCGLGTSATRAAIIEALIARGYITRRDRTLVPTEKGLAIHGIVKSMRIADAEMTGMWESAFAGIEKGEHSADNFRKGIEIYASQITEELLNTPIAVAPKASCGCPKCGEETIRFYPMVARCANQQCDFICFRTKSGKTLTDTQLTELFEKKTLGPLNGFKSKAGKEFSASLVVDGEMNIKFVFSENGNTVYKKGKPKKKQ